MEVWGVCKHENNRHKEDTLSQFDINKKYISFFLLIKSIQTIYSNIASLFKHNSLYSVRLSPLTSKETYNKLSPSSKYHEI